MTSVNAIAKLSAPILAANASHNTHSDGFARALEAASSPDARGAHEWSRESDDTAHTETNDRGHAAEQGRRTHDAHATTRRTHGAATDAKAGDAKESATGAADAKAAGEDAAAAAKASAASAVDGAAGVGDQALATSESEATAAAVTALLGSALAGSALAGTTTDSVGPGIASSGEASQDPTVAPGALAATPVVADQPGVAQADAAQGADGTTTDTQTASAQTVSAQQDGAALINHAGASSSRPAESASAKAAVPVTTPVAPGDQAAAVAPGGATASGPDDQASGRGARERTAAGRPLTAAGSPASAGSTQTTTEASAQEKAAPVLLTSQTPASQTPAMVIPDVGLHVSAAAAPTPAQAAAPASPNQSTFPVPLSSQLSGQMTSLRQLPHGEHILTLTVNPETFGPVKVVARITHDGVTLQLFGANDQARAALKAALPDLRRDLAGTGLQSNLELGSDSGAGSGSGGRDAMGDPSSFARNGDTSQHSARPPFEGTAHAAIPISHPTTHATRRGGLDLVL